MNKGRIVGVALVISVAINLLLIGGIIGKMITGPRSAAYPLPLGWVGRNLDESTRSKINPVLRDYARAAMPLRREMRLARREFNQLLTEEMIDEGALEKSLIRLRKASADYQKTVHHQMLLIFRELEPAQRRKVARFLMSRPRREGKSRNTHSSHD